MTDPVVAPPEPTDRQPETVEARSFALVVREPFFSLASLLETATNSSWNAMKAAGQTIGGAGASATAIAGNQLCVAIIGAVRQVSNERDRSEIVAWFAQAGSILASGQSQTKIASDLYTSINTLRTGTLVTNLLVTTLRSYQTADIPLALKVAIPATAVGAGILGLKGVGIAGFGSAIGMPVVVLLFLGSAGVASIVEAFVRAPELRDPLARLIMSFIAMERARRFEKAFLDALRADAMVPARADTPSANNHADLIAFLLAMDPVAFERHVMSFFATAGFPTGLTPRSNDYGVDGYITHPDGVVVVQCKRYALHSPVGRPAIQQFKGVIEEQRALRGFVVTTSRFTEEAIASSAQSKRVVLIDGSALSGWHSTSSRPLDIFATGMPCTPHPESDGCTAEANETLP